MSILRCAILLLTAMSVVLTAGPSADVDSLPIPDSAQSPASPSTVSLWAMLSSDGITSLHDAGSIITSPLHAPLGAWVLAGSGIAAVGLCGLVDEDVRDIAQHHQSMLADAVTYPGYIYGNTSTVAVIGGTLYASGLVFGNPWLHDTGRRTLVALILAGATSTALKFVVGRARPYNDRGAATFDNFATDNDYNSFPSGHTTAAFTVSAVLAGCIDNPWASTALYGLACLTAVQRVYDDKHWLSDVAAGALIGTLFGHAAARVGRAGHDRRAWRIEPTVSLGGYGLVMQWRL